MNKAIFIDLDVIVKFENKAWVVNKKNANVPIFKIEQSDFNLIKSGIYKNQGNKLEFNGIEYYLPNDLMNKIKVKCKNYGYNISDLAISLQEFLNKSIIDKMDFEINQRFILDLKNDPSEIYIICSKKTKKNYESLIKVIEENFHKNGLKIKNFYFISENFMNEKDDDVKYKKMRLFLQHLVGYRTSGDKFIDEEITRYDQIFYYDTNSQTLNVSKQLNNLLEYLIHKTDPGLREVIKEDVVDFKPVFWSVKMNDNELKKLEREKVILSISKIIKNFESFNLYF